MQSVWSLVKPYLSPSESHVSRRSSSETLVDPELECGNGKQRNDRIIDRKNDELKESDDVRYNRMVEKMREKEYPQLRDALYLDNASLPVPPLSLLTSLTTHFSQTLISNPHSHSPSSLSTSQQISNARTLVLQRMFGVSDKDVWEVMFTSGATESLRKVGELFDYGSQGEGKFVYAVESHTSLVGVRELAAQRGVTVESLLLSEIAGLENKETARTLLGLPLQCNASGQRYDSLLQSITSTLPTTSTMKTCILLDAASYFSSPSAVLDLSTFNYDSAPDFIAFSFYKALGYPTGLGGLVIKRSSMDFLKNDIGYFGGGAVDALTTRSTGQGDKGKVSGNGAGWVKRKQGIEGLENGTINVHAILGLRTSFQVYDRLFGERQEQVDHLRMLARELFRRCGSLKHGTGGRLVKVYTKAQDGKAWLKGSEEMGTETGDQAPTLNFNLLDFSGSIIPPQEVDRLACIQNIHIRSGRHCNPGFIIEQVGGSEEDIIERWRNGESCDMDEGGEDGKEVMSSLRVSLGMVNTLGDIERFVGFLDRFFLHPGTKSEEESEPNNALGLITPLEKSTATYELKQIMVYPIKSCGGQSIASTQEWPLESHGLAYDREWVIVSIANGKALSQKKWPRMALIRPQVDLDNRRMTVKVGEETFDIALDDKDSGEATEQICDRLCGEEIKLVLNNNPIIEDILTNWLGIPCTLARQLSSARHSKLGGGLGMDRIPLLLSNESPYLLINEDSVDKVSDWIVDDTGKSQPAHATSFRGNFVFGRRLNRDQHDKEQLNEHNQHPFIEDSISSLRIGPHTMVALGRCRRCQMVSIDQETGEKSPETYYALAKHRRNDRGRLEFGMHLMWRKELSEDDATVQVGMPVMMTFTN